MTMRCVPLRSRGGTGLIIVSSSQPPAAECSLLAQWSSALKFSVNWQRGFFFDRSSQGRSRLWVKREPYASATRRPLGIHSRQARRIIRMIARANVRACRRLSCEKGRPRCRFGSSCGETWIVSSSTPRRSRTQILRSVSSISQGGGKRLRNEAMPHVRRSGTFREPARCCAVGSSEH